MQRELAMTPHVRTSLLVSRAAMAANPPKFFLERDANVNDDDLFFNVAKLNTQLVFLWHEKRKSVVPLRVTDLECKQILFQAFQKPF